MPDRTPLAAADQHSCAQSLGCLILPVRSQWQLVTMVHEGQYVHAGRTRRQHAVRNGVIPTKQCRPALLWRPCNKVAL